jgi:hypothetical protein
MEGLRLVAIRDGVEIMHLVATRSQFPAGLAFVQAQTA